MPRQALKKGWDKLKICMISGHGCVRVQKIAIPLLERGHEVHLICSRTPTYFEQYDTVVTAPTVRQYLNAIDLYKDKVDIFHVHNEPSWYVTAVKERSDTPVVLDVHDSHAARITEKEADDIAEKTNGEYMPLRISWEERNNFQMADGLIFVSKPFADIVIETFDLSQKNLVLPSFLPDFMYQYDSTKKNWRGGLVYEGRVDLPDQVEKNAGYKYCDYLELAKEAAWHSLNFHLYAGRNVTDQKYFETYKDYAILHNGRAVNNLLKDLGRHDWGLVGNIFKTTEWDIALPNKLFEYIAAGVPVVAINAEHSSEWIKKYRLGITVESIKELKERWFEHREIRAGMIKNRHKLVMQNHIHRLEAFYKNFI